MKKKIKRGDILLDLLYQVYENGSCHEEVGMGSFSENVAIRILKLIDSGILTTRGEIIIDEKELIEYVKVERPVSSPSIPVNTNRRGKK